VGWEREERTLRVTMSSTLLCCRHHCLLLPAGERGPGDGRGLTHLVLIVIVSLRLGRSASLKSSRIVAAAMSSLTTLWELSWISSHSGFFMTTLINFYTIFITSSQIDRTLSALCHNQLADIIYRLHRSIRHCQMFLAGYGGTIATMWAIRNDDAPTVARDVYELPVSKSGFAIE
jgi:hypothetical protein